MEVTSISPAHNLMIIQALNNGVSLSDPKAKMSVPFDSKTAHFGYIEDEEAPEPLEVTRLGYKLSNFMVKDSKPSVGMALGFLNYGFVELQDVMGTDETVVNAARTSYSGQKLMRDDEALLRHLFRHEHATPFEFPVMKFRMLMPIFCMRQHVRHRISSMNEMSGRYVTLPDLCFLPELHTMMYQSTTNKQGRSGIMDPTEAMNAREKMREAQQYLRRHYEEMLETGLAKEMARINVPVAQYTLCTWQANMRSLMNYIKLRCDSHAQYELRQMANCIYAFFKNYFPITAKAIEDYVMNGVRMSEDQIESVKAGIDPVVAYKNYCLKVDNKRERSEFWSMISDSGVPEPVSE